MELVNMDYIIIEIHVLFFFKLHRCKKLEKELFVSLGTLIGFISALVLFFGAIVLETDNYLMFINIPSIIMVLGGTLANAYISYQAMYVNNALKEAVKIFNQPKIDQNSLIKDINRSLEWADIAFKQGPPGLEEHLKNQPEEHEARFKHRRKHRVRHGSQKYKQVRIGGQNKRGNRYSRRRKKGDKNLVIYLACSY